MISKGWFPGNIIYNIHILGILHTFGTVSAGLLPELQKNS
jgi:hypothetical protein